MNFFLLLANIGLWLFFFICLFVFSPLGFLLFLTTFLFDKQRAILHYFMCMWAWTLIHANPFWQVHFKGLEHLPRHGGYVMIANHQSMVDILVLDTLFHPFRWVAKKELFRIPLVGWLMTLSGYIPINRGNRESTRKMTNRALDSLKNGISVMIFPEGTRTHDGTLGRFKEGAFRIAKEAGVGIVPILISGAMEALPKNRYLLKKRQHIIVEVYPLVSYDHFKEQSVKELSKYFYNQYQEWTK